MQRSTAITTLGIILMAGSTPVVTAQDSASHPAANASIDADAEKVLLLSDFESEAEFFNASTANDLGRVHKLESRKPVWLAQGNFSWTCNHLDLSDAHVSHGNHSLKGHANVGSGHAWTRTLDHSFPGDWSDFDAIRFFAYSAEDKPVEWAFFIWMGYSDADGKRQEWQPWLLFDVKPGNSQIEIPLSAFEDLKWKGPIGGIGVGCNMTAMNLWSQDKKYEYVHKTGWKFDDIRSMAVGLRGKYDPKVPHDWWIDYLRLVKKKKATFSTSH